MYHKDTGYRPNRNFVCISCARMARKMVDCCGCEVMAIPYEVAMYLGPASGRAKRLAQWLAHTNHGTRPTRWATSAKTPGKRYRLAK